ncbi:MAG TPA: hypothetical protein VML96_04545 [Egibacteraceae bacterium]|nr:hypothetical protein [Egibacteraceae bacterium]
MPEPANQTAEFAVPAAPAPEADLAGLNRLVGRWRISGGAEGTVTYEWMEGGFFLLQHVDLVQFGQRVTGVEIIGHERDFGSEPGEDIRSTFYDSLGDTLRYIYEIDGETLTIWGGEKGSPAHYRGEFSPDGSTFAGSWVYPGGGGYDSTATRIEEETR